MSVVRAAKGCGAWVGWPARPRSEAWLGSRVRFVQAAASEHDVLAAVEQLADGVQVAGVRGGLHDHVHGHRAEVRESQAGLGPSIVGPGRRGVQR